MRRLPELTRRQALGAAGATTIAATAGGFAVPALAQAEAKAPADAGFHREKLGGFEIVTLLDGAATREPIHETFGMNVPEDELAQLLTSRFLPETKFQTVFAPVLINTGTTLVLFDTGNDPSAQQERGLLLERLEAAGYSADQIGIVVLTHFHPDHVGGLTGTDGKPRFPKARYVAGRKEFDFWMAKERLTGENADRFKGVQAKIAPVADKMTFLEPEGEVVGGIRAVEAFGHTPGHMGFHIESEGKRFLVWADTTNHYVASLERPDWHVRFDMDKEAAAQTRKRIFDMVATDRIPVSGYHMPFPGIGFVEKTGTAYRWVPETYQLDV